MNLSRIFATIPTFHPDTGLYSLVESLADSCFVLVSDDGSSVTSDNLLREVGAIPHVKVLRHTTNSGIARGLNEGLAASRQAGCDWLLTVDQDTLLPTDYVSKLSDAADLLLHSGVSLGALGAGSVNISGATMRYPGRVLLYGELVLSITEEVIQSGTIWNVDAMTSIGGFNEAFGIDAVDAHACLRLREQERVIGVLPDLAIEHRLGSARSISVGRDRTVFITGHSPQRRATMLRNRLALFPGEFRQSPRHALRTLRRVLVNQVSGLVLEGDTWAKLRGSLRGLTGRSTR
jgi:rhamnosyltransferase